MLQTGRRFALFAVLLLASGRVLRQVSARSGGAPVAACGDLTQQHFSPPTNCGSDCPFSVSLVAIDGMPVPPGAAQTYKCGSEHTLRVATSDPAQTFRGFAIQARESTETFSSEASFLGEFVNAPASGDWRIWSCDADSATHTNANDKTSVDVTWQAPTNFGPNVTMWFSITRIFTNFHAQIRGLQLSPSAECPPTGTLRFSCQFQVEGNHIVASSCQSEGFIPASFECQIDDQPKYTCTSPFLFPLDNITGVGEHTVRVIANTFFPDSVNPLTTSSKFTINPRLDCTTSQSDSMFNVKCTPNDQPDSVSCTINGASHTPCELGNIQIDARDFEAGSSNVLVVSFTANGLTAERSITFSGLGRDDPFEVNCSRQVSSDQMTIIFNCVGNRAIVSQVCTLNKMEIPDCKLPLSIAVSNLSTGVNTLEINLSDAAGETVTYATNISIAAGLSLACATSSRGGSLDVFCEAKGGKVTSVTCNYDNGAIIEPCNLNMSIDLAGFEAGDHILLLTVETEDGRTAQANIPFRVVAVPFQANCVSKISEDNTAVFVECTANRDIASQICTLNGVDIANCTLPLEIAVSDLITGNNSIRIVLVDEQGASATFSTNFAVDRPTELSLQCETSTNDGKIQVSCVAEGGVVSNVTCVYDGGAIIESCALDISIDVNRFEAGSHMLVIIARTADGLMGQAIIRFSISVKPLKLFCNVYGLPGRVDISCEASRELAGLANCSLDIPGFPSAPCNIEMFSVTDENLTPREYVLIINATDVLGQSASLNVPFTLTAGVEPGFRILIGSVLLGQRPELLDFAARSGSTVSVMAADTPRTVVVQRNVAVTINCSNWFNDNPGNSTYISRTQLDELGNELSEPVRLLPEDNGRIMVNDKSVTITRTLLVQGAEDPDFSLFMCVSCMTTEDGLLENCASASVTVYPIGSAPKIDAAADGEPPTVGEAVTTTKVGADFCLNFPTRPSTLQIICNDVNEMGVVPVPSRSWYKDGILAITQLDFGQVSFNEDFLNQGRNGLLRFGTLEPSALIAIPGASPSGYGELFLNFMNLNITGPGLLPSGVNASNLDNEVFSVLLGRWECRVDNTFGEDSAVTELSDCAIVMFVLDCTTTLAGLSGPLRVNCFGSRDIESVECSYDNGTMVEACNFPVTVDFNRFDPGSHTLLVNVMSTGGEIATHEVVFMVPDPLVINCTVSTSPGVTKVDCDASKELFLSPSCSLLMVGAEDSQPLICSLTGIELTSDVYQPGEYVLTITAIDVEEQTTTVQVSLTVRGAGDSLVQCRTTLDCSGNMTLMSARDCCVSNPDGLSFTVPGVETCQVCIVYGWFNDSFTGKEQGSSVSIPVGYQKGAAVAAQNLVFDVADQPITAKRGPSLDYTLNSPRVRALFTSPAPDNAIVTFRVDAIAQEPDETLILLLNPLIPGPTGDAVFFRDNITLTIVDSDTVEIGLAEDDFRTGETGQLPVVVAKSSRIASPITLTISPLTVDEAVASGKPLPPNIPEDNPLSPSRANLDDFNNTVLTITFEADEDTTEINEMRAPIPIINDVINEAIEQVFVIQLSLVSSLNPAGVDISSRSASLGRIIDDDPIRIGFEEASYTFSEPTSSEGIYSIYLAKENNVVSEQTFHVDVEVSGSVPPGSSLLPATLGNDYRVSGTNSSSVIISFPPSAQRASFSFVLLPDDDSEGDEGFLASSMPSDSGDAPTYLNPIGLATESLVVISGGPIEPLLYGQCILDPTLLRVYCNTSLDETLVPFSYTCSYNSGPAEPCSSDFFIDALRFGVGFHILDVTIATEFGQVLNVPTIPFVYEGPLSPMLECVEIADARVITLGCSSLVGGLVDFATCSFDGGPGTPCKLPFQIDQYSFSTEPHTLTVAFNLTTGREGEYQFNFTGEVREPAVFELPSDEGVIDIIEGIEYEKALLSSGFTYSSVPIRVDSLTYSEYMARGFNLEDDFNSNTIPTLAANAYDYKEVDTTLSGLAGGFFVPPSLSLNAYQDGIAEQPEGFVLLLDIVESELDPRDVGNVSLSRSVYLVRINQSDTSNFQVLIGDVELGQDRPELLDVAAMDGESVRVFVTDEIQTAIVTNGASILLDWFRWVTETLSDSAINATFTIQRIELDENGDPDEEAEEVESNDRIEVEFESDENEYYVKISRVIAREIDDEDPDRTIYILKACVPQPDGGERCYSSNVTVFAIQVIELRCIEASGTRLLAINCSSPGNGPIDSATCSFDGGPAAPCSLSFLEIDQYSFSPGPHTLNIVFNLTSGEEGEGVYEFTGLVREPGVFRFSSNRGVIDITEGIEYEQSLQSTGFSYSTVPIQMYTLTYSEYAARGFNLEDTIDSSVIPAKAASAYDYGAVNTTLPGLAGGSFSPPSLSLNAYQDGVAEELEGFVLYLEIVESELDPRDVGSVSVSRSAYLIRINQSNTSNFELLIGDVELGQEVPGLLDVAARDGDRVRVFVTDDVQTAIVTNGVYILLDWSRWVTEVLGDSASSANFTIRSIELDENGDPVEDPEEVESNDRIEVEFESDESEYYVKISRVVARETAEDDPDRHIYELEACVAQPGGSDRCYTSNITVFAIDTLPPTEALELDCSVEAVSGTVTVTCGSNNPLESPEACTLEALEEESFNFSCNAALFVISVDDYPPGEYNLTIEAEDIFDQRVSEVVPIFISERLLIGSCYIGLSDLTVFCNTTLDQTQVDLDYFCSYDSGPFESCGPNFVVDERRLAVGLHSLDITISTELGQVLRVPTLGFVITELMLVCFPVANLTLITFSCSSPDREIDSASCSFDDGPAMPCDIESYTIDQFSFSPGPHILTIVYNVTSGRVGEYRVNFTGEIRPPAIFNELQSDDGIIDITEGQPFSDALFVSGFSYGPIPIRISTLTYSEYAARGLDLEDDFNASVIPMDAADVYDYRTIDTTISPTAGSPNMYELTFDAYLDGLAEELEGFVLYLEVMESELDPRDVGQITLSRSVYLVVINQSDTSNFEILIGDVLLGQDIPGLVDVAARDGDRVRVFITNETQTAVVTEGAYVLLDWFRWVTETLGDSAVNATFTLYRTELNESGDPIGPAEVVNASTDRIEIEFEFDESEFYVKITEVVARESEDEDPDRAIYELEACIPQPDGSEQCYSSDITVFAIDTTPQLEFVCSTSGFDGMVTVSCESNNPLLSPQMCTPLPLEVLILCNASSFTLSVGDYIPGYYNFTIDGADVFGQTATVVVPLFLSEPILFGSCILDPAVSQLAVFCNTSLDQTLVPLEYTCSYDSGPEEPCGPNIIIDRTRFSPGPHLLDVTIMTLFGQTLRVPSIPFFVEVPPIVELQCDVVPLARVLTLNCSSPSGPVALATCSFDGGPPILCDLDALVIDQFAFSPGFHMLNISALVAGGQGSFLYNFTGQVRPSVEIELSSDEGLIDVNEGELSFNMFLTEGFSYGSIVITMSILTYSEYEERSYNLTDSFDSDDIPANPANDYDYNSTLGREARIVFDPVGFGMVAVPPPLGIYAYIDGLAEKIEGLVVYLELVESELDSRDVGQVALERSTYLIRINQSRFSTFEIIIGEVELGQRPELLEVAAQPRTEVLAFVTEDQQTAVAAHSARIRLDWSQWVEDELGSSAGEANYTIYRTQLNITGGVQGPPEVLSPTPSDLPSRIVVRINPENNEFYVEVLSVNIVGGAEDPDHAIYELEACYFEDDGSRDCERTSITLYAIGQVPVLISADEDDEPEETPSGLRSPVGADFCLTFDSNRRVLELTCDIEVENTIPFPLPERLWYKDGVLVYEAKVGEGPVIREEFYQTGNNSLLMPGVISPLPLVATSDGTLFLDWRAINLTLPDQLPTGVTEETFRMELFKTLLGTWECELENSLGESEAETTLTDCATDAVDLECESSIGNVFVRVMECEAEFELVDIQCSINRTTLGNCSFPLSINRLDYSEYQHTLRINVTDSRGMTDTFELQFNGVMAGNLPALSIDFQVLDDPRSPGAGSSRVVFLPEAPTTSSVISIEVSGGDTVAPIPFHVLPLTYDEFEARYPNVDLNDLFPLRPLDPAGDSDFNTNSLTFTGPSSFSPNVVIADSIPELSEGFIIYLEVDRANTDPRDFSRIQFLNRHILAVIEDDDALVTCNANVMDNEVIVNCPGIDGLPPGNPYQCSVDFSPPESCLFPYEIARSSVPPGRHNIRLFQRSAGEPIPDQILGGAQFQIDPLSIRFVNDTPILNVDRVYAEIEISRPGVSMECHLTRVSGSRTDCSNGRYEYTGLRPGDFTLRVVAKDPFVSERSNPNFRAIARNRLWVHGDNVFCVTHLKNDGITVDQNTLTVDFYSTGNPTGFLCSFDRGEFFECSSPYIRDNIPIGRHRIKVIPQGCGRDFRGHTAQFDVI